MTFNNADFIGYMEYISLKNHCFIINHIRFEIEYLKDIFKEKTIPKKWPVRKYDFSLFGGSIMKC